MVKMLPGTIGDLRNPEKHLDLTVKRLIICAGRQIAQKDYEAALRIWNTGKANGKTYHADYVPNGLSIKRAYAALPAVAAKTEHAQGGSEVVAEIKPGHIITPATDTAVSDSTITSQPETDDLLETVTGAASAKPDTAAKVWGGLMRAVLWLLGAFSALSAGGKTLVLCIFLALLYVAYHYRAQARQQTSALASKISRALKKLIA
jgi:hypothetical protein